MDVKDYCKMCDVCNKVIRDFAFRTRPLNPLPIAQGPFWVWNVDHEDLCQKTKGGSVAVLCCTDAFSGRIVLARY